MKIRYPGIIMPEFFKGMTAGSQSGDHLLYKIRKMFKHPELLDQVKVIKISTDPYRLQRMENLSVIPDIVANLRFNIAPYHRPHRAVFILSHFNYLIKIFIKGIVRYKVNIEDYL